MKTRFAWLKNQLAAFRETFVRFPLSIVTSFVATGLSFYLIELDKTYFFPDTTFKIILALTLAIYIFAASVLLAESMPRVFKIGAKLYFLHLISLVLLLVYFYLSFPYQWAFFGGEQLFIRFDLMLIFTVAYLMCAPFFSNANLNAFWHYNKTLLFRAIFTVIFVLALLAGFAAALFSIDELLGINIADERYPELFVILGYLFGTLFFLSGVPRDFKKLASEKVYPRVLQIFTQYVLLPLALTYLLILYAYVGKIIVLQDWPNGWVAMPILIFSIVGLAAKLLLYPLHAAKKKSWAVSVYYRWFYVALLPLLAVLFMAFWKRISEYGVTEMRFLGVLVGIWLLLICIYFLSSKHRDIRFIPISLGFFALVFSFGRWGVFSVSEFSQANRLAVILQQNGILVDGRVQKVSAEVVPDQVEKDISESVRYLYENHDFSEIDGWFELDLAELQKDSRNNSHQYDWGQPEALKSKIMSEMGLRYIGQWEPVEGEDGFIGSRYFSFYMNPSFRQPNEYFEATGFSVEEFEKAYYLDEFFPVAQEYMKLESKPLQPVREPVRFVLNDGVMYFFEYSPVRQNFVLRAGDTGIELAVDIFPLAKSLLDEYGSNSITVKNVERMTLSAEDNKYRFKFVFSRLEGEIGDDAINHISMGAVMLVGKK